MKNKLLSVTLLLLAIIGSLTLSAQTPAERTIALRLPQKLTLTPKNGARSTSCPAGQHLYCYEDHEQMMSVCVCAQSGGGGKIQGTLTLISD
jgi:hypothetical protein